MHNLIVKLSSLAMLLMCLLFLGGCGNAEEMMEKRRRQENKVIVNSFRTVEYNGHRYIVYREFHGASQTFSGMTHDPDCGCGDMDLYGVKFIKNCECEEDCLIQ